MSKAPTGRHKKRSATELALRQAKLSHGSMLRAADLKGTSAAAATKALARLANRGVLTRVAKGLYYSPKETLLGTSKPSMAAIATKNLEGRSRPTGATAANLLGLSTQIAARPELVAFTTHKPKYSGAARIKLRRGARPEQLPQLVGALLEVLRDRGRYAETDPGETYQRLRTTLQEQLNPRGLRELSETALEEPPRVRAMLGALFAWIGLPESLWKPLKASLNPLSRFDFGHFGQLPNAKEWQAK